MADYLVTDTELTSVANAIRTKGGTSAPLSFPAGFVSAVGAIPTGGAKPSYLISDGDAVSEFCFNTGYDLDSFLSSLTYSDTDPGTGLDVCYLGLGYFFGVDLTNAGLTDEYALVWNDGVNVVPIYATCPVLPYGVTNAGWQVTSYQPSSSVTVDTSSVLAAFTAIMDNVVAKDDIAFGEHGGGGQETEYYLTFSSASPFTLGIANATKNWNGAIYYSTDKERWTAWTGTSAISSGTDNKLYLCGLGNTVITGNVASPYGTFVITGTNVSCTGNIECLLDFSAVIVGVHPTMSDYAFSMLFYNCTKLTSAPSLPATTLAKSCYRSMFRGCSALTTAPSLPATTLAESCYRSMFQSCISLTTAPSLPATTLAKECYYMMFIYCRALTTAPSLPATTLAESCYYAIFMGCSVLKLSETQTGDYVTAFRIPKTGNGQDATGSLSGMFYDTGGTFTGTPSINTTYYTSNTVV